MPFLLFFTRFDNLKIIKIRIPSHPCHIVTVHSEMSSGKSIALLVGENVGWDFSQFLIIFSIQGVEDFCVKSFLGGGHAQVYGALLRDGDCRNHIFYIKVIALYQAQLCRLFQIKCLGAKLFLSGLYQKVEITSIIHIGKSCHLLSAGRSKLYTGFYLNIAVLLPPRHQTYVIAGIQGFLTVEAEIARTFCQAGVAVIGLAQGSIAHI